MISIALVFITAAVGYVLDGVLVGLLFGLLLTRMAAPPSTRTTVVCLLLIFALLDNYWWPAVHLLDLSFTIANDHIAQALGFGPDEPAESLFSLGFFELMVWFVQSRIALAIAKRVAVSRRDSANTAMQATAKGGA